MDNDYIKQAQNPQIITFKANKYYVAWENTEEGHDRKQMFEVVGDTFINFYSKEHRVYKGDPFYNTLMELKRIAEENTEKPKITKYIEVSATLPDGNYPGIQGGYIVEVKHNGEIYKVRVHDTPEIVFKTLNEEKERLLKIKEKFGDFVSPFDLNHVE